MGKIIDRVREREAAIVGRERAEWLRKAMAEAERNRLDMLRAMHPITFALADRAAAGLPWWAFWRRI